MAHLCGALGRDPGDLACPRPPRAALPLRAAAGAEPAARVPVNRLTRPRHTSCCAGRSTAGRDQGAREHLHNGVREVQGRALRGEDHPLRSLRQGLAHVLPLPAAGPCPRWRLDLPILRRDRWALGPTAPSPAPPLSSQPSRRPVEPPHVGVCRHPCAIPEAPPSPRALILCSSAVG